MSLPPPTLALSCWGQQRMMGNPSYQLYQNNRWIVKKKIEWKENSTYENKSLQKWLMSLRWAKNSSYFIYTSSVTQYEHCVIVHKFLQREICKLEFYNNCNPREKDIVLTQSVSPGIGTQYKVCLSIVTLFSESVLISWCFCENKFTISKWLSWGEE